MKIVCAVVALLWAASAWGQVTITGPIRTPTGEPWDGELRIQSQMMFCGGVVYPPTMQRVKVVGGQLSVSVQPTDVCGTGYSYTVYYVRWGRTEHVAYWIVPSTPATTTVEAVQTSVVPSPQLMIPLSQLGTPGPAGSVIVSSGTAWVPGSAMVDVTQSVGDLIYRGSAGTLTRLPIGAAGQVLSSDGSVPVWSAPSGGGTWGSITGTLSDQTDLWGALSGKANTSHTHAAGDIVSGTMVAARLGGGTPTSSTFLRGDSLWAGVDWASIVGKPSVFPPSSHSHLLADLGHSGAATGQVPKWNGSAWVPASDDTGGSPSWGSITGTLSNQTDLQSALDNKAATSHTHAASDVTQSGASVNQALIWSGAAWEPAAVVNSVFGRAGAVTAQAGDYAASQIGYTPGGGIAATDVQAAIAELDSEKAATSHTHAASDITAGTIATARLGSGAASSSTFLRGDQTWDSVGWTDVSGKPSTFPPSSHTHQLSEINQSGASTGQVPKWNGSAWVPASDDTGGSPSWGSITGTLSDQADLQAELDSKASTSHTHAATDITSGTMAPQRLGSGTPSSSTYLRGDGVWAAAPGGQSNLYVQTQAAVCQFGAAATSLTLYGAASPLPACRVGSNVVSAVLDFPDTDVATVQGSVVLAGAFSSLNLRLTWDTQATTGSVVWQVQTACVADGEGADPSWNAAQTVVDAAQTTAGARNEATLVGVTVTGCAAGETMYWRLTRDPAHASDTIGDTASLHHLLWEVVR